MQWSLDLLLAWTITLLPVTGLAAWISGTRWSWLPDALIDHVWWLPAVLAVLAVADVCVEPGWRYRVHRWEVSCDVVYTRTGWFTRQWLLVPVGRIQTVDTAQGWAERALGLATVKINTASHEGSSQLAGLPVHAATRLAEALAHRAHDLRDDAT